MLLRVISSVFVILGLSLGLAGVSNDFASLQGWVSFLGATILGGGLLLAGWWAIKSDPAFRSKQTDQPKPGLPTWLGWLLIAAALLRLGAGALWFVTLPDLGYGGEVERAGYVMSDAHRRDTAAWRLAQSDQSLTAAFTEYRGADQYGGLLFVSAWFYRSLGGDLHQPLQLVVLTAAFSALAVTFTWAAARRFWSEKVAALAAWIVALFPDAVLLGSSQMREAFMIPLVMMAFYGLVRYGQDRARQGIFWIIMSILVAVPLSPLFALMLAGTMFLMSLYFGQNQWFRNWRVWAILLGFIGLGILVLSLFGNKILPGNAGNPIALLQLWLKQAARWQAYNSEHASGWVQQIFRTTPAWMNTWLLLLYGVARPFLPAAMFDPGASIWQGIAIWRSLGWTLLLPFLFLSPWLAWRKAGIRSPEFGLSLVVWLGILLSSFRGGGDAWDNPRYRVTWIGLQAILAAWVWVTSQQQQSPWLRRTLISVGMILIWWFPWYFGRITSFNWPIKNIFLLLGCGLASAAVYLFLDIWFMKRRTKHN